MQLLVICGPTASGKSALAMALALCVGGEIVSADSMQVYRGMDIGTAKPSPGDIVQIPHHMIDIAQPNTAFSVAQYQPRAQKAIEDIASRGKLPILCGGTGLYIHALLFGHDQAGVEPDMDFRRKMQSFALDNGAVALHALLAKKDAAAAMSIHPNNVKRVIRALEILRAGERPYANAQPAKPRYDSKIIGLHVPREQLYLRIDERVDQMISAGLEDEVRRLEPQLRQNSTACQAIGYKEFLAFFDGGCTREEAICNIKKESRRYAKRQMTWFRKTPDITWVEAGAAPEELVDQIAHSIAKENS